MDSFSSTFDFRDDSGDEAGAPRVSSMPHLEELELESTELGLESFYDSARRLQNEALDEEEEKLQTKQMLLQIREIVAPMASNIALSFGNKEVSFVCLHF